MVKVTFFIVYAIMVVPFFPLLPPSAQSAPDFHTQFPHLCPCPCVLCVCSLTNPFTSFQTVAPPSSPLRAVSPDSMPLVLFFSLVYFLH